MSENTKAIAASAPQTAAAPPKRVTETNWDALTRANLKPVTVYCQQYPLQRNMPFRDQSCHTRLPLKAEVLAAHTVGQHGGGFMLCVRTTEGKPSKMWDDLRERGFEAFDFRCAVCDKAVSLQPNSFGIHMRPHSGMTKQAYQELARQHPNTTGFFNVVLRAPGTVAVDEDVPEPEDE